MDGGEDSSRLVGLGLQVRDRVTRGTKVALLIGNSPAEICDEIDVHDRVLKVDHRAVHRMTAAELQPLLACSGGERKRLVLTRGHHDVYAVVLEGIEYERNFDNDVRADDHSDLSSGEDGESTPRSQISEGEGEGSGLSQQAPNHNNGPSNSNRSSNKAHGDVGATPHSPNSPAGIGAPEQDEAAPDHHVHGSHSNAQARTHPIRSFALGSSLPPESSAPDDPPHPAAHARGHGALDMHGTPELMEQISLSPAPSPLFKGSMDHGNLHESVFDNMLPEVPRTPSSVPSSKVEGKPDDDLGNQMWDTLRSLRSRMPLIQCITNFASMDIIGNGLLAAGAIPAMVHASDEAAEAIAAVKAKNGALYCNIGTLSDEWVASFKAAVHAASEAGVLWILDPLAVGFTDLRTATVLDLLDISTPSVIACNEREAIALATALGVIEAKHLQEENGPLSAARAVAVARGCVVALLGQTDRITNGTIVLDVQHNAPMIQGVAAARSLSTALIAAFVAGRPRYQSVLLATAHALAFWSVCSHHAQSVAKGPGSFRVALIDALSSIKG